MSSVELTQAYLDRINRYNETLNAFITVSDESALSKAKQADALRAKGDSSPLLGIPLAHKDIFCTEGVKTTCGSKILHNFISPYDATVVTRFNDAGAVMLGKTNMD
ncbi:MAG TPA: Asp-tRNA(Asn)/Glu-tRNA(Gln) amidotransferase GatCAB subunit A, partial [Gammaproteobacteria bacterium]|nr:Asp-tRNA(Asn)/Glu-tRNA(Gln) amidotransferase GatCAB subunit A [Gammaproteobacteria bacterium]